MKEPRPIPKKIENLIKIIDKQAHPQPDGHTRYYSYFVKGKSISLVWCAVRSRPQFQIKQVAVHTAHEKLCLVKDVWFTYIGGYHTGWNDHDEWFISDDKFFRMWSVTVNKDVLLDTKYKYSGLEFAPGVDPLAYLEIYDDHPIIEMLAKIGAGHLYSKKKIVALAEKSKAFRKFLYTNKGNITVATNTNAILRAFKEGTSIQDAERKERAVQDVRNTHREVLHKYFSTGEYERLKEYCKTVKTTLSCYADYLEACDYLHLDMTDTKNRFPNDFAERHDTTIDDMAYRKKVYEANRDKSIEGVAKKYLSMTDARPGRYVVIIPHTKADLEREGECLHHCVGRMGYDAKIIDEKTLIFFLRKAEDPCTPFVTIEYSLESGKILQIHADHNATPEQDVIDYAYKTWLPYAKKQRQKIA